MSGTRAGALKGWHTRRLRQRDNDVPYPVYGAYEDWLSGRAYLDGAGNYKVRPVSHDGYFVAGVRTASWNVAVKRHFGKNARGGTNVEAFDRAARRYVRQNHIEVPHYKTYGHKMSQPQGKTFHSFQ